MSILAAILILGASGSASRSMESDDTIAGIVAQCAWGAVSDVINSDRRNTGWQESIPTISRALQSIELTIDGQSREGLRAWGKAVWRVGGYVGDWKTTGDVQYQYRLRIRGYNVLRQTRIENGRVVLTTDAWWVETVQVTKRITRRVPIHVTIRIKATERGGKTVLVGTATGVADTREFRCGLVRRIAERQASDTLRVQLPAVLRTIERGGRKFYAGGADIAGALDKVKLGIKIGGRLRR